MKLIHWNIHMWLTEDEQPNYKSVKEFIKNLNPDIVTLTEVEDNYKKGIINKLAKELDYMYIFCPCFDFIYDKVRYSFGNAILSKTPFANIEHKIITPVEFLYDGNEPSEPRSVTWTELYNIPNFKIGITHLPRKKKEYREFAIKKLKTSVYEKEKFVLSGDFNISKSDLKNFFYNFDISPAEKINTYPCSNPKEDIDHIIYNGIKVKACRTIENYASDHFPIIFDFEI